MRTTQKPSLAVLIAALSVLGGCETYSSANTESSRHDTLGALTAEDVHVHDPVIMREDGTYYLFGTGNGIAVHSSKDLRSWEAEPPVFPSPPAWTYGVTSDFKGHIWAPDISYHNGRYYLYYSISSGGKNTSAIGVATNATLDHDSGNFQWVDHGPVIRSIPNRDLWNAIDANIITDDQGIPWMAFGSFWGGLKLVKLSPDRLSLAEPQEWHSIAKRERSILVDDRNPEPAAIEAPFIFKKDDYYYLFVSWDYCCRGTNSTYKILVGRSKDITGPYLDKNGIDMAKGGGSLVLAGDSQWPGVGHNSAYTFDGSDYLVFHGYDATDEGQSKLKILEMTWENGWPQVDKSAL